VPNKYVETSSSSRVAKKDHFQFSKSNSPVTQNSNRNRPYIHEILVSVHVLGLYSVSQKNPPPRLSEFFHFFHKRLRIFNRFFSHLLHVPMYARLQIFIQLSPTLTKLCHIKRDYPVHIICAKCPKRARSDVCVSR